MTKNAYIVSSRDYVPAMSEDNTIICDEASLVATINVLIGKDKDRTVIVRKCGLVMNEMDSDQYRMGAWGKTSGE